MDKYGGYDQAKSFDCSMTVNELVKQLFEAGVREQALLKEVSELRSERAEWERKLAQNSVTKYEAQQSERLRGLRMREEVFKERAKSREMQTQMDAMIATNASLERRLDLVLRVMDISGYALESVADREPEIVYRDRIIEVGETYEHHSARGWYNAYAKIERYLRDVQGVQVKLRWTQGEDVEWMASVGPEELEDAEPTSVAIRADDPGVQAQKTDESDGAGEAGGDKQVADQPDRSGEAAPGSSAHDNAPVPRRSRRKRS